MQLGSSTIYGDLKVTGLLYGSLAGKSATAEALATARTITFTGDVTGSVIFDGSQNVSMTTTIAANSVALGTDTTGNYVAGLTAGTSITIAGTAGEGWSPTVNHADTSSLSGAYGTNGISSITVDGLGHVTAIGTATYLTSYTESDTLQSVTSRGKTTTNDITITNATSSTTTATGALIVTGGVGIGGNVNIGGHTIIGGNLTVNGTTITMNSTITTLDDPVITLGGDTTPTTNDAKDRGVEYRWHNGTTAKIGFFGVNRSSGNFTFIPDATNTSEVFSGTKGIIDAYVDWSNINSKPSIVNSWSAGTTGFTPSSATSGAVTLGGTLKIANGGTGATTTVQGGVVYGASTSAYGTTAVGTSGQVLRSNGASAPTWITLDLTYLPDSSFKKPVKAATTANITLSGTQTIDGIALVVGDRVLVKDQTTASQNGIYIVGASTWSRATSADASTEIAGGVVSVDSGTVNGGQLYTNYFKSTDTVGTTTMNWYKVYSTLDSSVESVANKLVLRDGSGNFNANGATFSGRTIHNAGISMKEDIPIHFRPGSTSYYTSIIYGTNGNECMSFVAKNSVTSFQFVSGSDPATWNSSSWTTATPALMIKGRSVYVNELIPNGSTPTHTFKVTGNSKIDGSLEIKSWKIEQDETSGSLKFIFG